MYWQKEEKLATEEAKASRVLGDASAFFFDAIGPPYFYAGGA
ncbi:MAG: hypothetical protein O7A06_04540 [Acidobacteria bacterium]|nr:hypothetical protein [Acidobacteriota bacterium]MCZ6750543.1 hypothetical protein [Acidobacteriota bacterium]